MLDVERVIAVFAKLWRLYCTIKAISEREETATKTVFQTSQGIALEQGLKVWGKHKTAIVLTNTALEISIAGIFWKTLCLWFALYYSISRRKILAKLTNLAMFLFIFWQKLLFFTCVDNDKLLQMYILPRFADPTRY